MNVALGFVTRSAIWRAARPKVGDAWALILSEEPVPLICAPQRPLFFTGTMGFRFEIDQREGHVGGWKVSTTKYTYSLRSSRDDEDELIAWHWNIDDWPDPHVHVLATHGALPGLDRMHIPTNRVFFEDVLLFTISELGATHREGATEQLIESRRRTRRWASWR
jgi:hypothetical protein